MKAACTCVRVCVPWVRSFVGALRRPVGTAPAENKLRSLKLPHELVFSLSLPSLVLRSRCDRDGCPGGRGPVQISAASAGCAWSAGALFVLV